MTTDTGLIERAAEVYRELGDVLTDEERWTQTHFLKARNIISDLSDRVSVLADEVLRASMAMLRKNNGALLTELSRAPEGMTSTGLRDRAAELLPLVYAIVHEAWHALDDSEEWSPTEFLITAEHYEELSGLFDKLKDLLDGTDDTTLGWEKPLSDFLRLLASPAPAGAEGWVLVPKEATREMAIAAHARDHDGTTSLYHKIWAAMIAASPAPAQARPPAVCHVCGEQTETACADCQITFSATVYVCSKASCRDAHERKCFGPGNSAPPPAEARELVELVAADLEYDRCSSALLKAQADHAARGIKTNPAREQVALTKAAIRRRQALAALPAAPEVRG